MSLSFSIIISTYPAKTKELSYCLKALMQQKHQLFEVIVVNDGEDAGTEKVIKSFSDYLNLSYCSRKNDLCPSRSRNTGANKSKNDLLIFLDSDILLNPQAINVYSSYFEKYGRDISVWGLSGFAKNKSPVNDKNEIENFRAVFADDELRRYIEKNPETVLFPCCPYFFAYSGNFAISQKMFFETGGFNETFIKWGGEDIEFGYRLHQKKVPFYFSAAAWGEHLRHEKKGPFYEDKENSPGLVYLRDLLEHQRNLYFSGNKEEITSEWQYLINSCKNKEFPEKQLKLFLGYRE